MQAVILAAGKGVRMRPLTLDRPKPLIEVGGRSILERNLEQLAGLVSETIIVVGYRKEKIREKIGSEYVSSEYGGMKVDYVVQEKQLGTGHALLMAEGRVKGKFLVLNGDDLYSRKDMENLIRHENCILLQKKEDWENFGVVQVEKGKVVGLVEKPSRFVSELVNTGMFCFSLEVFSVLRKLEKSERGEYEITDAVRELAKQGKMDYELVKGYWIPVGKPEDVGEAEGWLRNLGSRTLFV